ncbi:uncharacterized protein LOC106460559 [Limulus polyphemus]|uniref:Uncharacterized protein LOC106460559 n=1 Tax=Limulus polyphemus TaxID=6850 RepID=A0ABM1SHB1_LIMPO|nr:uncharacterized protein LOC106460559 [Limulus polyphemus]XP_022243016.1 uncharacterized protein LOC106460559 [Limulus polyphemus]XP_022243017.1 uncharacterized protein LOC106460559 [Limulus polyphemus]XP_022243018.1 uncharacterized protein LOC106460559 [Limulus polyphemus]
MEFPRVFKWILFVILVVLCSTCLLDAICLNGIQLEVNENKSYVPDQMYEIENELNRGFADLSLTSSGISNKPEHHLIKRERKLDYSSTTINIKENSTNQVPNNNNSTNSSLSKSTITQSATKSENFVRLSSAKGQNELKELRTEEEQELTFVTDITVNYIAKTTSKGISDDSLETKNASKNSYFETFLHFQDSYGALTRTMYVVVAGMMIVILYFVIRMVRSRRKRNKSRKYGLITTPGSELEMQPLDKSDDDDDEDTVLFEAQHHKTVHS